MREGWDFDYVPVPTAAADDDGGACDVVVAFREAVEPDAVARLLAPLLGDVGVDVLLDRPPLHWVRVRSATPVRRARVLRVLRRLAPRYVASAIRPTNALGAPARWSAAEVARATTWKARKASVGDDPTDEGRWFLREGIALDRARCGTGAGTRLAVVDEDLACAEHLDLDATPFVGVDDVPRASFHGALMVGWAVGTKSTEDDPRFAFRGVAPDASPRIYCVPKAGIDVVSLPLAIVRAVCDGADVVLATTFVEGSTSPMLDDALELAVRLGRGGRGASVVMAAGRQASSPEGSMHASWTLSFGDPASDPRVTCVAPSGRDGAWFMWRDRRGRFRPFANRGPAVRYLAPGDDVSYPFRAKDRPFHAESSGAAAIAAGAHLLVLANNPRLLRAELDAIVTRTCEPAALPSRMPVADAHDLMPRTRDRDGHDAKHGFGVLHATRACLAARDPIAGALVAIGEDDAAAAWFDARRADAGRVYTARFARWAARARVADAAVDHALRTVARHARLVAASPPRATAHGAGALARQLALVIRALGAAGPRPTAAVRGELRALEASAVSALESPDADARLHAVLEKLWRARARQHRAAAHVAVGAPVGEA